MIFLQKIDIYFGSYKLKKKHVFVNNKRTVIAREIIFFFENMDYFILSLKKSKINFEKIENSK